MMFKWIICICDDNRQDEAVKQLANSLENMFEIVHFNTIDDFLTPEKAYCLIDSHIVIVDMQWKNNFSDINQDNHYIPEDINPQTVGDKCKFISEWIKAVSAWSSAVDERPRLESNRWPQTDIQQNDIGAWIGAMLSHVAPKAQIIFWSQFDSIFAGGVLAAIGRFRQTSYEVHSKDIRTGIRIDKIWPYLETSQKRELQNPPIRQWFLKDVVLPLLAGEDPIDGNISLYIPSSCEFQSKTLAFNNYFPNLVSIDDKQTKLAKLKTYLSGSTLSPYISDLRTLEHDIRPEKKLSLESLRLTLGQAYYIGEWGRGIAEHLNNAQQKLKTKDEKAAKNSVKFAHQETLTILENARPYINECVHGYEGNGDVVNNLDNTLPMFTLGFPIYWIQRALTHLHINAVNNLAKFKLSIFEDKNLLTLEWLSEWQDLENEQTFWKLVAKSLKEKGENRGLPLVILCGIESDPEQFSLMVKDNWRQVWPPSVSTQTPSGNNNYQFGVRFIFKKILSGRK